VAWVTIAAPADRTTHGEPDLARALPLIRARLQVRHPEASDDSISECLVEAVARAESARVRTFLPILVERWADLTLTRSASGDGLHDRDGGAVGHRGVEPVHEPDVVVVDEHVDVADQGSAVVEELVGEPRVLALEGREHLADGAALDIDLR
jgi:hypothetical protein